MGTEMIVRNWLFVFYQGDVTLNRTRPLFLICFFLLTGLFTFNSYADEDYCEWLNEYVKELQVGNLTIIKGCKEEHCAGVKDDTITFSLIGSSRCFVMWMWFGSIWYEDTRTTNTYRSCDYWVDNILIYIGILWSFTNQIILGAINTS